MSHLLDDAAPALAKWLAPYVAAELNIAAPGSPADLSPDYDETTCAAFLAEIGDPVLPRALKFFAALAEKAAKGEPGLESRELAVQLGVDSPRQIPALLTNSLKRRAKALGLPRPWAEDATRENRTLWIDRNGIAGRMVEALMDEELRRLGHPSDDVGGRRASAGQDHGGQEV